MTDQERKVMKLALDALNELTEEFRGYDLPYWSKAYNKATDAINSLRQTLAQSEQDISYTDIQMEELIRWGEHIRSLRTIEAALKEKNT